MADFSTLLTTVSLDKIAKLKRSPGFLITPAILDKWATTPQPVEGLGQIFCFALVAYSSTDKTKITQWLRSGRANDLAS